jgi:hypothetical protein
MRCTSLRLLRNLAAAISIGFVAAPTAALADLITLAIPGITGDVRVAGQEKTIEVLSLSNTSSYLYPEEVAANQQAGHSLAR